MDWLVIKDIYLEGIVIGYVIFVIVCGIFDGVDWFGKKIFKFVLKVVREDGVVLVWGLF